MIVKRRGKGGVSIIAFSLSSTIAEASASVTPNSRRPINPFPPSGSVTVPILQSLILPFQSVDDDVDGGFIFHVHCPCVISKANMM